MRTGPFCRQFPRGTSELNPLFTGAFVCFDKMEACSGQADADSSTECRASGEPHWHCFSMEHRGPTYDPMNRTTACLPSQAMCDSSRPVFDVGDVVVGTCTPLDSVYCYVGDAGALMCFADDAACTKAKRFLGHVLPGGSPSGDCAPRRSTSL